MDTLLLVVTILAALGSGAVGGVFFAFSSFVMRALARLPGADGMAAMQAINVVVINPHFLGAFFGAAVLSVGAIVLAWVESPRGWGWLVAGGALYLVGTFGVTIGANVPRNEALARIAPADDGAEAEWRRYVREWTRWNHVRTVAALLATAAFCIALLG